MRNLIPHLTQKFAYTPLAVFFRLRLLGLYTVREMVFIKRWCALFDHLDTAAQVNSIYLKSILLRFIHLLD